MTWETPVTPTTGTTISVTGFGAVVTDDLTHLYGNLPIRATMPHDESLVLTGNALTMVITTTQYGNFYSYQNAAADADSFTQSFVLLEGTYTLHVLGVDSTSGGKIDWYIDDVAITTGQDWYAAAPAYNVDNTVAAVEIAANEGGRHVLKGVVNGKHASSSGYAMRLTKMYFTPAADA